MSTRPASGCVRGPGRHWRALPIAAAIAVAGCAPRLHTSLYVRMMKQQEHFLRTEVVPAFSKDAKTDVDVVGYTSTDSLVQLLQEHQGIGVLKVPFDKSASLARLGLIRPLEDFLLPAQIKELEETFVLTRLGMLNGRHYYLPRKYETRIMVFRKSKVADAVRSWQKVRSSADSALKTMNGAGLPAGYALEEDPNRWDYFDVFMAGWVWSHASYGGSTGPRIAHRGKKYSGTSLRIVDRVFQCGGDTANVLTMSGDPVIDAFYWEAIYAAAGVYNPRMWQEAWSGTEIWQGFRDDAVFLAFMTQLDCFFIHGTGQDSLDGYLEDPDDLGVAVMPAGCSALLTADGATLRPGCRSVTTGGWWWGIPRSAADPQLSYRLVRHLTSTATQIQECSRFGMVPVRKDILSDMSMMFGGGWITEIYETSFRQLVENRSATVPANAHYADISGLYLEAWYDIVAGGNWSVNQSPPKRDYVAQVLAGYERRARAALGR